MPELPEVETVTRTLRSSFIGRSITGLWCNWPRMLNSTPAVLQKRVVGCRVGALSRRAKFIVWHLQAGQTGEHSALLMHLRMSGRASVEAAGTRPGKHVHFVLKFDDGSEMHFDDARKFGRVTWTDDLSAATAALGVEPLEPGFTPAVLGTVLTERSRQLKPALLDQSLVAGLGNIYTDEALHRARLHPLRKTDSLRRGEIERLHAAIVDALQMGIRHNGASLDWVYPGGEMQKHFAVYGRTGEPCPRCNTPIRRLTVSQRGTHVCPKCQQKR